MLYFLEFSTSCRDEQEDEEEENGGWDILWITYLGFIYINV